LGTTDERKREEMWGRNSQRKGERERLALIALAAWVMREGRGEGGSKDDPNNSDHWIWVMKEKEVLRMFYLWV
jgi:hypothetical protein